jgi:ABC-type lipoprotein release transport system permease subunit
MLTISISMQDGSFEIMIDNGARLILGHLQLQQPDYQDDPRLEYTFALDAKLLAQLERLPNLEAAAPRLQAFALVSAGERSFGAQILGVDPALESQWSTLPDMIQSGRYLEGPGDAVAGSLLARNLGIEVGDELVLLGTAQQGGVAASVAVLTGTFTTGQPVLDRSILQIPIDDFRSAWEIADDEVHALVMVADTVSDSEVIAEKLGANENWQALSWRELMPEAVQMVEMKAIGAYFFFALIAIIVTFSVVNTFMMTIFERTPEFGMLMAIGMKPGAISAQLQLEALWLALLGIALGGLLSVLFILPLTRLGIPLPADAGELLAQYNMPDRMYPAFSFTAAWLAALIMLVGTQLAALLPGLRIRRLRPVNALRAL